MVETAITQRSRTRVDKTLKTRVYRANINPGQSDSDPAASELITNGGESFSRYLKSVNLSRESEMLVLPTESHYFYDEDELRNIRILINPRRLNQVKHTDKFLNSLVQVLPTGAKFLGCFHESRTSNDDLKAFRVLYKLCNKVNRFFNSGKDQYLNKNEVSELLERHGFVTIDMREMDGLTYFCSRNERRHSA